MWRRQIETKMNNMGQDIGGAAKDNNKLGCFGGSWLRAEALIRRKNSD